MTVPDTQSHIMFVILSIPYINKHSVVVIVPFAVSINYFSNCITRSIAQPEIK